MSLLRRGRIVGEELDNVRMLRVAAYAAFAHHVHNAGQNVTRAAAEATRTGSGSGRPARFAFVARMENLRRREAAL